MPTWRWRFDQLGPADKSKSLWAGAACWQLLRQLLRHPFPGAFWRPKHWWFWKWWIIRAVAMVNTMDTIITSRSYLHALLKILSVQCHPMTVEETLSHNLPVHLDVPLFCANVQKDRQLPNGLDMPFVAGVLQIQLRKQLVQCPHEGCCFFLSEFVNWAAIVIAD